MASERASPLPATCTSSQSHPRASPRPIPASTIRLNKSRRAAETARHPACTTQLPGRKLLEPQPILVWPLVYKHNPPFKPAWEPGPRRSSASHDICSEATRGNDSTETASKPPSISQSLALSSCMRSTPPLPSQHCKENVLMHIDVPRISHPRRTQRSCSAHQRKDKSMVYRFIAGLNSVPTRRKAAHDSVQPDLLHSGIDSGAEKGTSLILATSARAREKKTREKR